MREIKAKDSNRKLVATGSLCTFLCSLLLQPFLCSITWASSPIRFEAEHMEYRAQEEVIITTGNVRLIHGPIELFGQEMRLDIQNSRGQMKGDVNGRVAQWFFRSNVLESLATNQYILYQARLTSCEKDPPDYTIRATKLDIIPDNRILGLNAFFYLGEIPVFWTPIYRKSLKEKHISWQFVPSYSEREGFAFRNVFGYPLTDYTYGKLYLEPFTRLGLGTGAEFNYRREDRSKGSWYAYYIKEESTGQIRYQTRLDHWNRLTGGWTAQASTRFQSDEGFNNLYFRENLERISKELRTSAALVHQTGITTTRLSLSQFLRFDPVQNGYFQNTASLPQIEINTIPSPVYRKNLLYRLNLNANHAYDLPRQGYFPSLNAGATFIMSDLKLGRRVTWTPQIGYEEGWRGSSSQGLEGFTGRFRTGVDFRFRPLKWRWLDVGVSHNYQEQIQAPPSVPVVSTGTAPPSATILAPTTPSAPKVEENKVQTTLHARTRHVRVRFDAPYRFPEDWSQQYQSHNNLGRLFLAGLHPVVAQVTVLQQGRRELFFQIDYSTATGSFQNALGEVRLLREGREAFSFGLSYQRSLTLDRLVFSLGVETRPIHRWIVRSVFRLDYPLAEGVSKMGWPSFFEKELVLKRELHDFWLDLIFRERRSVLEAFFLLSLKFFFFYRKTLYNAAHESEFYPWRK